MPRFDPQPYERVVINSTLYEVMPNPVIPSMAFGQEGRKATVYQLRSNGEFFALKVFKRQFQDPSLVQTCQGLAQLNMAGLEVCARQCLTHSTAQSLIEQYSNLDYAVLMPWIRGSTWFDIVFAQIKISEYESQMLAKSASAVLSELEKRSFAHCDIAGGNVIVNSTTRGVSFVDVEDMFGPILPPPNAFPQGTDGYQHQTSRTAQQGQWCAEGDRFSAAILIVEMLTWHHPRIRQEADTEHYFAEDELQDPDSRRYRLAVEVLASISRSMADCFEMAWHAPTLADAPPLSEWAKLLEAAKNPEPQYLFFSGDASLKTQTLPEYQCTHCKKLYEQLVPGGRCPQCGGRLKQMLNAAVTTSPAISGFRCLACGYETAASPPGGRCSNCGSLKVTQVAIQAQATFAAPANVLICSYCHTSLNQVSPGGRCPNCGTKIKV